jgi:hypothetical protein
MVIPLDAWCVLHELFDWLAAAQDHYFFTILTG